MRICRTLTVIALTLGLLTACASSLQPRYDQLARDRDYAVAAIEAWQQAYRDGQVTTPEWHDGREAYDAWEQAHQAYLDAIQSGRQVNQRQGEQALALGHFQQVTASYGIVVKGYP